MYFKLEFSYQRALKKDEILKIQILLIFGRFNPTCKKKLWHGPIRRLLASFLEKQARERPVSQMAVIISVVTVVQLKTVTLGMRNERQRRQVPRFL